MNTDRISQDEMVRLFGTDMPVAAVKLLWDKSNPDRTVGELREELRRIAAERDGRPLVEATQADREAAAEIGERFAKWTPAQVHQTLTGGGDEYPIVQAFARHRLASIAND